MLTFLATYDYRCFHRYQIEAFNNSPAGENPSCLQTTAASCTSHSWSQTVPHLLLKHISTLPSCSFVPLTSRTPNVRQDIGGNGVGCGAVVVGQMCIS